ncbi:MAG TPA: glycoside hydrolase family 88 protein [Chitinophagaceae bacterium]|nr:glycoside hydrolase family 88 protein [Chitinophagaceae bacterium]
MNKFIIYFTVSFMLLSNISLAQSPFKNWPPGRSPQEIGQRVADRFLLSPHGKYGGKEKPHVPYFEVCTWYGALTFADETNNKSLQKKLIERFVPLFDKDTALLPVPDHVDYNVFGTVPIEIYLQTKEERYFTLGKIYADTQWGKPAGPRVIPASWDHYNKGYTWQTRLWIDDMYMITMVQSQAYRATGDKKYIDRAAKEMILYLDSLQKPNGLFYHAPASPFFWGRGNGWMAAGMTELLRTLPKDNPYRPAIMQGYTTMMRSLLDYQAEDGMWRQLIDDSTSWKETSSTGMFAFAMITGVKNGWLNKIIYGDPARKAWIALTGYINDKAELTDICEGTGAGNNRQYYIDRKRLTGDFHGQAPVLWCASALLRENEK